MNAPPPTDVHPLALRKRGDLRARRMAFGQRGYWNVQDPLSLRNYQLRDEEHFVLSQLDGRTSLEEIQARFRERFAPRRVSAKQLHWFLGLLHREGLVVADAPGQGEQLLQRRTRLRNRQWLSRAANVLAIRFRGINPDPLLDWLYPLCRWLFSWWCVAGGLLLIVAALLFAAAHFEALGARLPSLRALFDVDNVIWLAVALAAAKILHELAHALTCRHFGGRCRELGLMLLAFTPCLYCNVSDSWLVPSKWKRIAISAAGMYAELVLAAACLFLWWYSEPGLLNSICLNLIVVCSISTVVFNGNPLLRYDGYFILADLLETPNLGEQSLQVVRRALCRWLLGLELDESPLAARRGRWLLASYAVCAVAYRTFLVLAILWLCHSVLKVHRLAALTPVLVVLVCAGMLLGPLIGVVQFLRDPTWSRRMNAARTATTLLVLVGIAAACCLLRFPSRVSAPVSLRAAGATPLFVPVGGTLIDRAGAGHVARPGEVVARLENLELERQITELAARRDVQRLHIQNLERQQIHDSRTDAASAGGQLPPARQALADLEQRLLQKRTEQQRLAVRAPQAGTVLPPPRTRIKPAEDELPSWSGTPLDENNLGCRLAAGTVLCSIGDPQHLEAVLVVRQDDIPLVKPGQRVRVQLDELPARFLEGRVAEISELKLEAVPPELAAKQLLRSRPEESDPRPLVNSYQVRVQLLEHAAPLTIRASGRAKILVEPRSLAQRGYEFLCRTFRIDL